MTITIKCAVCHAVDGEKRPDGTTIAVDIVECGSCHQCPLLCDVCGIVADCPECHRRSSRWPARLRLITSKKQRS